MPIPTSSCLSPTEARNPASNSLSNMKTLASVELMVSEEMSALNVILSRHGKKLARLVDIISSSLNAGNRLIYCGAGSSGRLAKMDSIEVMSTFGTSPELVTALLAGGNTAAIMPKDDAEDTYSDGVQAMTLLDVCHGDTVLGITASGQTAFVWGALEVAQRLGATITLLTFNPYLNLSSFSIMPDLVLSIDVGPEVLTGSTRLKCGTATKCILDVISTLCMVKMNRTKDNLMIYATSANEKLRQRAIRAFRSTHPGLSEEMARSLLEEANYDFVSADSRLHTLDVEESTPSPPSPSTFLRLSQ